MNSPQTPRRPQVAMFIRTPKSGETATAESVGENIEASIQQAAGLFVGVTWHRCNGLNLSKKFKGLRALQKGCE